MKKKVVFIKEIYISKTNQLYVKPKPKQKAIYDEINRSGAKGIMWDGRMYSLFTLGIDDEQTIIKWYKQVCLAVKEKYGDKHTK